MAYFEIPPSADDWVILTGRMCSGKDYVAEQAGYTVYGIADPIYKLTERDLGTSDKSEPGVRAHMQKIGAWGRGEVSEKYPLTEERAEYVSNVWDYADEITGMGTYELWQQFGSSDFWVQLLHLRTKAAPEPKIAITNGRFPEEINFFTSHQYDHYHVMCTEQTRRSRLEEKGEPYDPEADSDITEALAAELDMIVDGEVPSTDESLYTDLSPSIIEDVASWRTVIWNDPTRLHRAPFDGSC